MTREEAINRLEYISRFRHSRDSYSRSDLEVIETVLSELEKQDEGKRKINSFLDKQIRCYKQKINKIIENNKLDKYMKDSDRRSIKYYKGKLDECEKIKIKIKNVEENLYEIR